VLPRTRAACPAGFGKRVAALNHQLDFVCQALGYCCSLARQGDKVGHRHFIDMGYQLAQLVGFGAERGRLGYAVPPCPVTKTSKNCPVIVKNPSGN
jgi:hypothetical protein